MIEIKVGSEKVIIKIKNPNSGEERTINKVLGDEDTLAKAQEHAGYYDMHNNHFIPQINNTNEVVGFCDAEENSIVWKVIV